MRSRRQHRRSVYARAEDQGPSQAFGIGARVPSIVETARLRGTGSTIFCYNIARIKRELLKRF